MSDSVDTSNDPLFTDVNGLKVHAVVSEAGETPALTLKIDGDQDLTLVLNKYDAKQLAAACEVFLHQQFSVDFSTVDSMLTAEDRMVLYQNELDEE